MHNGFTEESKIALRIYSIDSEETTSYRTRKDLLSDKEETKCSNIIK